MAELHPRSRCHGPQSKRAWRLQHVLATEVSEVRQFSCPIVLRSVAFAAVLWSQVSMAQNSPSATIGLQGVALDSISVERLSKQALEGSGEAARRLSRHFLMAQGNREEAKFWAVVAAENGDVLGKYDAGFLLKDDPDPRNRRRAIFWLKQAASQGDSLAGELLKELGEAAK